MGRPVTAESLTQIEVRHAREVAMMLADLGERAKMTSQLAQDIWGVLVRRQAQRFQEQRWAPLQKETLRLKYQRGQTPAILMATNRLYDSLATGAGSGDSIRRAGPGSFRFGTRVPYAGYLFGGTMHMPARRPYAITAEDVAEISDIIEDFVTAKAGV